ncbi:MAG: hypothetical protein IJ180_04660 [Bacteroidales bacterium]|nr:hypothetical protein [Bacteroidales bacterium]
MKAIRRILLLLFIAVFTGLSFVSCSDDEEDNISTWICKVDDGTIITMKLYEKEKKFHTTISGKNEYIYFMNDTWSEYKYISKNVIGVTHFYNNESSTNIDDDTPHWRIEKKSNNTMVWHYLGVYIIDLYSILDYEFKKI